VTYTECGAIILGLLDALGLPVPLGGKAFSDRVFTGLYHLK